MTEKQREIKPTVEHDVLPVEKEKTKLSRVVHLIVPEEVNGKPLGQYMFQDIFLKNARRIALDSLCTLFGEPNAYRERESSNKPYNGYGDLYSYTDYSSKSKKQSKEPIATVNSYDDPGNLNYNNWSFASYREMYDTLNYMRMIIDEDGCISVAQYYQMIKRPHDNYQLYDWGWKDLEYATEVKLPNDRWRLRLPKAVRIR